VAIVTNTADYEQQVLSAVSVGLHARFTELSAAGRNPSSLGDPQAIAGRMLATVPTTHPWDAQIGPFYDTPGLIQLLGVTKQAIADRARRRSLISAATRQGKIVYPTFQFVGRHLVPAISTIAQMFHDVPVDGWAVASWFTTPDPDLDGATPAQWLLSGGDLEVARELAADIMNRWSAP
jgi:hypothetical protein